MTKQQATRLYAVFEELPQVRRALEHLGTDNAEPNNLEIRSMIPLGEDLMPNATGLRSRVPLLAVLGGVLGGFGAYFLGTHVPPIGSQATMSGPPIAVFILRVSRWALSFLALQQFSPSAICPGWAGNQIPSTITSRPAELLLLSILLKTRSMTGQRMQWRPKYGLGTSHSFGIDYSVKFAQPTAFD